MLVAIRPGQMQLTRIFSGPSCAAAGMRHVHDRRLGDRIEQRAVAGADAGDRCGRDDRAAAGRAHQRNGVFHAKQRRADMQVHDGVEAFARDTVGRIIGAAGARIVEQDVEPAEMFFAAFTAVGDLALLHDVAADIAGHALVVFFDPRALVVLDVGGDDARALGDEEIDRGAADAAGRAGDDRDFAVQTPCHCALHALPIVADACD